MGIAYARMAFATVLLTALASCNEGQQADPFELDATIEDGNVVFSWSAGSMNLAHVFRCDQPCECADDGNADVIGAGDFVWTPGSQFGQPSLNSPLVYAEVQLLDAPALALEPGSRYIADVWLMDWKGQSDSIVAWGCVTFVAP